MRALLFVVVAVGSVTATSVSAYAADAPTAIDELKQGYTLKQAGNCQDAVPHFKHSFELDPKPKALLNLADCEAQLGELVAAQGDAARGRDLAVQANDQELASVASGQLSGIEKRLPHLTIRLPHDAPSDSTVSRDGIPVPASTLGVAVALNPGPHVIAVKARGRAERRFDVFVTEGANAQIEAAPGEHLVAPVTPPPPATGEATIPQTSATETPAPSTPGPQTAKLLAYAAFGLGAVGLTVGIATGLAADSKHSALVGECTGNDCPGSAQGDLNGFRSLRTWSTVGYVVGALGAAGGAVLWLTAPKGAQETSARVWVGPGAAGVGGRF
jgi:hypothetical protein